MTSTSTTDVCVCSAYAHVKADPHPNHKWFYGVYDDGFCILVNFYRYALDDDPTFTGYYQSLSQLEIAVKKYCPHYNGDSTPSFSFSFSL